MTDKSAPRILIVDLLGLAPGPDGGTDHSAAQAHVEARGGDFHLGSARGLPAPASDRPQFHYLPVLSHEPEGSGWSGARGFVHEAAKAHFSDGFAGHKAYLCGPPAMIEACIGALMQGRLYERDIYTEKFLSAADASTQRSPLFQRV